ncbi:MFS transporter [Microvirga sp. 2YAF29]|uniref:MFS transporter n=1 Tax=Microvirga sp. 2YAF29 TaxID=3233031 RepID=UPI003F9C21BD
MSSPVQMPWRFLLALSFTQLISYGTVFYSFALIIEQMERDLGWSKSALGGAYSLALVSFALCAVPVGRLIDKGYGRWVMTGGSALAAVLLAFWAHADQYLTIVLIWLGIGAVMSAVFYEASFAVLTLHLGVQTRRGITIMTLIAGFASTIFIPLLHWSIELYGWRGTLLVLAALNIGICTLVHAVTIPAVRRERKSTTASQIKPASHPHRILRRPAFWFFVGAFVLQGILSTGIPVHLIPMVLEKGFPIETAVAAYTVIGPAQVAARFLTGFGERGLSLKAIGLATMIIAVMAFALLPFISVGFWTIIAFATLYGAANGMITIVRALLPPELFGREDYGTVQGLIAMPIRLTTAAAPFLFGALWAWSGSYSSVMIMCLGMSLLSLGFFVAVLLFQKDRENPENPLALDG